MQASGTAGDRQAELDVVKAQIDALPEPSKPTIDPALAADQASCATAVAQILGTRLTWERVLGDVSRVLPSGVSLTELTAIDPQPTTPVAPTTTTTSDTGSTESTPPPAPPPAATTTPTGVTVTGYALNYADIARTLAWLQRRAEPHERRAAERDPRSDRQEADHRVFIDRRRAGDARRCPVRANMSNRTAIALGGQLPCSSSSRSGSSSSPRSGAVRRGSRATAVAAQAEPPRRRPSREPVGGGDRPDERRLPLAKALPEDTNVAAAMLDVDRLAARHGLTLEGFQPTAQIPVQGYYAQPVTVTVQGRFGKVSRFLGDLRKLVSVKKGRLIVGGRLYSVTEVRLSRPEGENLGFPVVRAGSS